MTVDESAVTRLRDAIVARVGGEVNERGVALLSAIMFMIIMAGLSVVLLTIVLGQIVPANIAQKGTKTIYAAEAGLQTSLNLLRSAATTDPTGKVMGDPSKLPCTLSGRVDAQGNGVDYSVKISYYLADPTDMTSAWRSDPANLIACSSGSGLGTTPKYALIAAKGVAAPIPGIADPDSGTRYLSAIYKFKVSNVNIPGGRIFDRNEGYCLDAAATAVGSLVNFRAVSQCTSAHDATQLWIYDTDYELKLASTTVPSATPLCITGPAVDGQATQNVTLQACRADTDSARWNQLWSWTGDYSWRGQKKNISLGPSTYCLATGFPEGTNLAGRQVQVAKDGCNGTFAPSSAVGAGAAGYNTHQLVNYQEFGRCADVTNEQITSSYMISYPCKQDPTGTGAYLLWNHKWYYSEPPAGQTSLAGQQIYVNSPIGKRCLQTPPGTSGDYVIFAVCDPSDTKLLWTRVADTGTYATSYLLVDTKGRCLAVDPTDLFGGFYSKIVVAPCDGSLAQKWNAPAIYTDSTVGSYREVTP